MEAIINGVESKAITLTEAVHIAASHSASIKQKVGALVVDGSFRILGIGCNYHPQFDTPECYDTKLGILRTYKDTVHAEVAAILDAQSRYGPEISIAYLFVTHKPCSECMSYINATSPEIKVVIC